MKVFTLIPSGSGVLVFCLVFGLFMVSLAVLFGFIAYSSRNVRFAVSPAALEIKGGMYGRSIPLSSLDLDAMEVTNLKSDRKRAPRWRTNGIGLPGYQSGWFKLRNGEKGLLFVTDRTRAVYIPTRDGYSLLVTPQHTDDFVASLRAAAHAPQ